MPLREKILEKARQSFNESGVDTTTLRKLAKELEISHGNLRYHFPGKATLLKALFEACLAENDAAMAILLQGSLDMETLWKIGKTQAEEFWKYRFLLQDLLAISRQFPDIGEGMRQMYATRTQQLLHILGVLREQGLVLPEIQPGYDRLLAQQYLLVVDFGLSFLQIEAPDASVHSWRKAYSELWISPLLPHLTPKGQEALAAAQGA